MRTRAAVLREHDTAWSVEEIELDPPRAGEVLVKTMAAGMCHSDEHAFDRTIATPLPMVGGHEGAGEVVEVGEGVTELAAGDRIAVSFIPSCGRCRWCVAGQQHICDLGMHLLQPGMMAPGGYRHHAADGTDLTPMLKVGTFAEHMVLNVDSAIKIDPDMPPVPAALVSCGVATGFGSVVNRAETQPGDTVVVVGCGGLGSAAVQAARIAGARNIIGVDPVELKREKAGQFGATHTAASMEEAMEIVGPLTHGVMADGVILTPGVMRGEMLAPAQFLARKGGRIVVTAIAPFEQMDVQLNLFELAMMDKEIRGTVFGSASPRQAVPHLLEMYQSGQLQLDEMVTRTYRLDQVNQGYQDMRDGKNIRGVIVFD